MLGVRELASKIKRLLGRVFGRKYPDLYDAVKSYAEKRGLKPEHVIASAVAAYLSADEEGKEELEEAMKSLAAKRGDKSLPIAVAEKNTALGFISFIKSAKTNA